MPRRHGGGEGARQLVRAHRNAGIGQGEQRHDHIAGPGVVHLHQALVRRDGRGQAAPYGPFEFRRRLFTEAAEQPAGGLQIAACGRVGDGERPHREPRDHGVDARLLERHPDDHGEHRVQRTASDAREADHEDQSHRADGHGERRQVDGLAVDDGDDQQRDQVVDHGDGQDEGPERCREPRAENREDAEGEGGVRGHRRTPAVHGIAAAVDRQIDENRHDHAADAGEEGQHHPAPVAQFAHVELAPRLQPHDEEEERHESAVDPFVEIQRETVRADPDGQVGGPHHLVRVEIDVRPDEGGHHGGEQHGGTARLRAEEVPQGLVDLTGIGRLTREAGVVRCPAHRSSISARCGLSTSARPRPPGGAPGGIETAGSRLSHPHRLSGLGPDGRWNGREGSQVSSFPEVEAGSAGGPTEGCHLRHQQEGPALQGSPGLTHRRARPGEYLGQARR